jgi:phosphoribosylformylglycinamidine synthase
MKFGIVIFPGSTFADDCYRVIKNLLSCDVEYISHSETKSLRHDCVVLPGGSSYGDHPRCGSLASTAPVMKEVADFAGKGGPVIAIGNGFQALTECSLLPGILIRNKSDRFICRETYLKVENRTSMFTSAFKSTIVKFNVAHGFGQYTANTETLERLENEGRVAFRYADTNGRAIEECNPEGSANNIAGILSYEGNVVGMMPFPERSADNIFGCTDGLDLFKSILSQVAT